ncbi:uncharacterized protein [Macrobrachium rosenbergii]|uniref:uncharacterized protein n=1 Tax=Macrobrachium rosenbergii TaxID=79674 RepID=UPI0034D4D4D7
MSESPESDSVVYKRPLEDHSVSRLSSLECPVSERPSYEHTLSEHPSHERLTSAFLVHGHPVSDRSDLEDSVYDRSRFGRLIAKRPSFGRPVSAKSAVASKGSVSAPTVSGCQCPSVQCLWALPSSSSTLQQVRSPARRACST